MCEYMNKDQRQQKRVETVKIWLEQTEQPKDVFAVEEQVQKKFIDEAQMSRDAVSLGEKKTWKPSEKDKQRNKKIDEGRSLTKSATKDTNYVYQSIALMKKREMLIDDEEAFTLLFSTKFHMHMLASANILKHFSEYMQLVMCYQKLKRQVGVDDPFGYGKRLEPIKDNMEILCKRMQAFTEQNRVHLDGTIMDEKVKAAEFHVDRERILRGDLFTNTAQPVYDEKQLDNLDETYIINALKSDGKRVIRTGKDEGDFYDENESLPDMLKKTLTVMAIKDLSEIPDERPAEEIKDGLGPDGGFKVLDDFDKKHYDTPAGRIADIVKLRAKIHHNYQIIREAETDEEFAELISGEELAQYKILQINLKARLVLAEAEARLFLAKKENDAKKIKDAQAEVKEAWEDYSKVKLRILKETLPVTSQTDEDQLMNRTQALSSESDKKNFKFKKKVLESVDGLDTNIPVFKVIKLAARSYALDTHYTIGCEEEAERLRALRDAVAEAEKDTALKAQLTELRKALLDLNRTAIPEFSEIPDSLKKDFSTQRLEEKGGSIFEKGHIRNSLMNNDTVRVWKDMRNVPLFPHEPTINDLRQGKISNCYMLAATTSLIEMDPQAIKHCVRDDGDCAIVRLYKGPGKPVYIRVRKEIPMLKSGGYIMTSGPLWMQMIEIAAAQVGKFQKEGRSGVGTLWYSSGADWLAMLTGVYEKETMYEVRDKQSTFNTAIRDADGLFGQMLHAKEQHMIYHMGTKESTTAGLNSGHAYTVLGAKVVNGEKYITLRNPYANMSYMKNEAGEEAMSSSYFSSVADATCGQFDIPLAEFIANAQSITRTCVDPDSVQYFPEEKQGVTLKDVAANKGRVPGTETEIEGFIDLDDVKLDDIPDDVEQVEQEKKENKDPKPVIPDLDEDDPFGDM